MNRTETRHYPLLVDELRQLELKIVKYGANLTEEMERAHLKILEGKESRFFKFGVVGRPQVPSDPKQAGPIPHVWSTFFGDEEGTRRVTVSRFSGQPHDPLTFHSIEVMDCDGCIARINKRGEIIGKVSSVGLYMLDDLFQRWVEAWTGPVIPPSEDNTNHRFIINQLKSYNSGNKRRT